jgi:hypothetical protein
MRRPETVDIDPAILPTEDKVSPCLSARKSSSAAWGEAAKKCMMGLLQRGRPSLGRQSAAGADASWATSHSAPLPSRSPDGVGSASSAAIGVVSFD